MRRKQHLRLPVAERGGSGGRGEIFAAFEETELV